MGRGRVLSNECESGIEEDHVNSVLGVDQIEVARWFP